MAWTVERNGSTYDIIPLRNPDFTDPSWKRTVRRTIVPQNGSDQNTYHNVGYDPWIWEGKIRIEDEADYDGVESCLGHEVTLSDGTDDWTTVLDDFQVSPISAGIAGYEGKVKFVGRS